MIGRCRHRSDFDALRRGRRIGGQFLWARVALDSTVERPMAAFAIGRRAGTAVQRNRLRRRIQAVLREHESELPAGRYLFGCQQSATEVTFTQVEFDVRRLVERARELAES